MPKKKRPSFILILGELITDSVYEIVIALVSGGYLVYQSLNGDVTMLEKIPVWAWWAVLVFFILRIAVKGVQIYRKELEMQRSSSKSGGKRKRQSNKADNNSVAMQDVKNSPVNISDSFNTSNTVPDKWFKPSGENVAHQIGVQIQAFDRQFKPIRPMRYQDKRVQFNQVKKSFEPIYTDLLDQANLLLTHTDIPKLIKEIHAQLGEYDWRLSHFSVAQEEYWGYITGREQVPPEVKSQITEHGKAMNEIANTIDSLAQRVMNSVRDIEVK